MNLILLISGNAEKIVDFLDEDFTTFEAIKIDEKHLSNPKYILHTIKAKKYLKIVFGTLDIEFQRFSFFIGLYLLLSGMRSGTLADNSGKKRNYNPFLFIIRDLPLFVVELFLSFFVLIYFYIKYPIIKKLWKPKH